jgi:CRISPR-associated endonuclease/helicase Cas3
VLERLELLGDARDAICVHLLMGGDVDDDWDQYPERDAILVGTQDMLLSRALNRGYAMSRYRWPMQFGLLNNDSLWVMDEVQLMSNGLSTTAQLDAFRRRLGTIAPVSSMWMSATMRPEWLATVDFDPRTDAPLALEIDDDDRRHERLRPRFEAKKPLARAPGVASDDGKAEAELVLDQHGQGSRTLIIVNTVKRAQGIYVALQRKKPKAQLVLIHSRFRPGDRQKALQRLLQAPGDEGVIGVCTQVVEAGVDVSARVLITDLAPWASLVQRFGRCNRAGEHNMWPTTVEETESALSRLLDAVADDELRGSLVITRSRREYRWRGFPRGDGHQRSSSDCASPHSRSRSSSRVSKGSARTRASPECTAAMIQPCSPRRKTSSVRASGSSSQAWATRSRE